MSRKLVVLFAVIGALLSTILYSVFVIAAAPAAGPHLIFLTPTPPAPSPQRAPAITHGQPHLFGPLGDFVGKYGQGQDMGSGQYNFSDADKVVAVLTAQNKAIQIMVFMPKNWSASEKQTYCAQFFPPGAYKSVDEFESQDGPFSLAILDEIGIIAGGQVD